MKFSVLSLNARFLSHITQLYTCSDDRPGLRLHALIDLLEIQRYDIICLQEVFNEGIRKQLREALLRIGRPYHIIDKAESNIQTRLEDSGLFFATSLAPETFSTRPTWHEFNSFLSPSFRGLNKDNPDSMAEKGVYAAALNVMGQTLWVFNLHLQSTHSLKSYITYQHIRSHQLKQTWHTISRLITVEGKPNDIPPVALLLGDFNFDGLLSNVQHTSEYKNVMKSLYQPIDYAVEKNQGSEPTWNNEENPIAKRCYPLKQAPKRLDYIFGIRQIPRHGELHFSRNLSTCLCTDFHIVKRHNNIPLSDHYGIQAIFELPHRLALLENKE